MIQRIRSVENGRVFTRYRITPRTKVRDRYVYVIDGWDMGGAPCYVGVGKRKGRMHAHVEEAKRGFISSNPTKGQYFIDCLVRGFIPTPYVVAEDLTVDEACAYEETLIAWYGRRDLGTGTLLNADAGGLGCAKPAQGVRDRRIKLAKQRHANPKVKAEDVERLHSPQARAKRLIAINAPGVKARKSKASKARYPEIAAALIASRETPEAKANHLKAMSSMKTRAKMSISRRNRPPHSPATIAKMKASQALRWEAMSPEERLAFRAKMTIAARKRVQRQKVNAQNALSTATELKSEKILGLSPERSETNPPDDGTDA